MTAARRAELLEEFRRIGDELEGEGPEALALALDAVRAWKAGYVAADPAALGRWRATKVEGGA